MHLFRSLMSMRRWRVLAGAGSLTWLLAACAVPADRQHEVDVRPRPLPGADSTGAQCVPEGQRCGEPGAVCCAGTSCARIGRRVCVLDH